jgi:large subunit ribosomal protein L5
MSQDKEKYIPRLLGIYREKISGQMKEKFDYKNPMAIPRLTKIVLNMGVGQGTQDSKLVDKAAEELSAIAGQRVKICRARKPISNFKLRKGIPIGCCVTLRRARMYEFLDRLITVALPRIRDFRGLPGNSFDGRGNYTFGLTEQSVFPELELDKISRAQGMNITFCTTAKSDEETKELMRLFGFPFRR